MGSKFVELRVDHNLVDKNFEGYKLSLDTVPVFRHNHTKDVFRAKPGEDQFSLLHVKLFAMQNHLHMDPWSRGQGYFINTDLEVIRSSYEESNACPGAICTVFQLQARERVPGDYNYTLRFISEKYCIICDGVDTLLLLNTGDRSKNNTWSILEKCCINTNAASDEEQYRNYTIIDARLDKIQSRNQISLALGHIQRVNCSKANNISKNYMFIYWATWSLVEEKWQFAILDTLEGVGALHYCAFEPKAESLIISSNSEYVWRSQKSTNDASVMQDNMVKASCAVMSNHSNISWTQTNDEINMDVLVVLNENSQDYKVQCTTSSELSILNGDDVIITHKLFDEIVSDAINWNLVSGIFYLLYSVYSDISVM